MRALTHPLFLLASSNRALNLSGSGSDGDFVVGRIQVLRGRYAFCAIRSAVLPTHWRFSQGAGAFDRLQGTLTNDLRKIGPGRAQYTHLLDDADGSVARRHHRVVGGRRASSTSCPTRRTPPGCAAAIGGADVTAERAVIAVQGPTARARLATVAPEAAAVARFRVTPFAWDGRAVRGRRHRLHRRGRRRVRGAGRRGRRRSGRRVLGAGVQPGRPRRPRHPAPRGRPAAARPRARPGHHPAAGRPRLGGGWDKPEGFRGRAALERRSGTGRARRLRRVSSPRAASRPAPGRRCSVGGGRRSARSPAATSRRCSGTASPWRFSAPPGRRRSGDARSSTRRPGPPLTRRVVTSLPLVARSVQQSQRRVDATVGHYRPAHRRRGRRRMLAFLGLSSLDELFDVRARGAAAGRRARPARRAVRARRAGRAWSGLADAQPAPAADLVCFAGAGAYDHEVPSVTRGPGVPLRVRDRLHALPARGGPGRPPGRSSSTRPWWPGCPACRSPTPRSTTAASAAVEAVNLGVGGHRAARRCGCQRRHPPALADRCWPPSPAGTGHQLVDVPLARRRRPTGPRRRRRARRPAGVVVVGYPNYLGCLEDLARRPGRCATGTGALLVVAVRPGGGRAAARPRRVGRRRGGGGGPAVRDAAVLRRPLPRAVRLPHGARAPAARPAGRARRSTPRAGRPTSPRCGPASRTSAARRPPPTSAPTRP